VSSLGAPIGLLICSNVFVTFACYAHVRDVRAQVLIVATAEARLPVGGRVPGRRGLLRVPLVTG